MRLSDIVSHAGLAGYAEVALVLFLVAFATILFRTLRPSRRRELEALRSLPFDENDSQPREGVRS